MRQIILVVVLLVASTGFAADNSTTPERVGPPEPYVPYSWSIEGTSAVLWDNGDTDGSNGYSAGTVPGLSARRSVLDDFVVGAGQVAWDVNSLSWLVLWVSLTPPQATGAEVFLRNDVGGAPDVVTFVAANVTGVTETTTGRTWFSRAEAELAVDFDAINIPEGTYWVDFTPIGPENSYAMVRAAVTGAECWVNYDDLGGLQSGTTQFGNPADLSFILGGDVVPVELQSFTIK